MKFLVDAQLPPAPALWLRENGHEAEDDEIWKFALANDTAIFTKDEDFAIRAQQTSISPAVVWLRIAQHF